jgi:lipopolysaccharide biosynthesis regulator YciM
VSRSERIASILAQLQTEPEDVFLNYALGLEYSAVPAEFEKAVGQFEKVLAIDAAYVPAHYHLGKLFETNGDVPKAIANYRAGLELARRKKDQKSASEFEEAIFLLES